MSVKEHPMSLIILPKILREKLSEKGAEALVDVINKSEERSREDVSVFVEDKFERRLAEEAGKLRAEISESKSEIIKWMFVFGVGQFWAIVGVLTTVLFAFFKP